MCRYIPKIKLWAVLVAWLEALVQIPQVTQSYFLTMYLCTLKLFIYTRMYVVQGVLQQSVILWKPRISTKTIHGIRNVICTCSLGLDICFFTFRINFEIRGWPPQPPTFSSTFDHILALKNKVPVEC